MEPLVEDGQHRFCGDSGRSGLDSMGLPNGQYILDGAQPLGDFRESDLEAIEIKVPEELLKRDPRRVQKLKISCGTLGILQAHGPQTWSGRELRHGKTLVCRLLPLAGASQAD